MRTGGLKAYLVRLHFEIQCALWAILLTGVLFFAVIVAPGIPAVQRRAAAAEAARFVSRCSQYCEKWGLQRGSLRHAECMQDLKQFRADLEEKLDDEMLP
ncbi:MAG TPA: hypothetical protein VG986_05560 [Pseudolabrys sp.]|nr:hypothetical protein [Pseudolabrys sp.]